MIPVYETNIFEKAQIIKICIQNADSERIKKFIPILRIFRNTTGGEY